MIYVVTFLIFDPSKFNDFNVHVGRHAYTIL
jgi:hypothetical protein